MRIVSASVIMDVPSIQTVIGLLSPTELVVRAAVAVLAVIGTLVIRRERREEMTTRQRREAGGAS